MRVALSGSSGLIGRALTRALSAEGHAITRIVRSLSGVGPAEKAVVWNPREGAIEAAGLEGHDVVVHLAGESIAGIWTDAKKRRIRESRVQGTTLVAETLAKLHAPPRVLFSGSAFGIYGDRDPSEALTESSATGQGFLPDVARAWEASTRAAEEAGIRVVHMRFGNVLSPEGGFLHTLLPFFRVGLGVKFGSGSQVWPWIAMDDIPPALLHVLEEKQISGPVNFVAPEAVTNEEFTKTLAAVIGRPAWLTVPSFAARLAPGGMAEELLLGGARVVPEKLRSSGYQFRYPELRGALKSMLR